MAQKYFKANLPKLENLRIARGWSREQLASKAILSTRTLDSIMAGKSAVLSTFSKLAKALETPVNGIVEGFELPQKPETRYWTVTIKISAPFDSFDEARDLPEWVAKLLNKVGGDEIWGVEAAAGSTLIRCHLTNEQHAALMAEFAAGNLADLDIINIDASAPSKADLRRGFFYLSKAFNLWGNLKFETREPDSDFLQKDEDKRDTKTG
jgi:transcriptional regulator with XRE-family HTH domain